jgi:hypothetical protein
MAWVTQLPVLVRTLPALGLGLALIAVLVFLARHPVDGDQRVIAAASRRGWLVPVALSLTMFLMLPSWKTLGVLSAVALLAVRFGGLLVERLAGQDRRTYL